MLPVRRLSISELWKLLSAEDSKETANGYMNGGLNATGGKKGTSKNKASQYWWSR